MAKPEYKFDEDKLLKELGEYIDGTYQQHYASKGKIQVTEFIMSQLETPDFLRGCVLKYAVRYGNKDGYNRKDILKAMHYLLLMLCYHDRKYADAIAEVTITDGGDCYATTNSGENFDIEKGGINFDVLTGEVVMDWETGEHKIINPGSYHVSSPVSFSDALSCNVYVKMEGGKIGQMRDGVLVEIGYGELDEHGCLKPDTFRYSCEGRKNR